MPDDAVPDDANLDRFRPPGSSSPTPRADGPWVADPLPQPLVHAAPPVTTWQEWSHHDRDRRERASTATRVLGERGVLGLAHAQAVVVHRSRVHRAILKTLCAAPLVWAWFRIIAVRDAAIAQGYGDRSFAPAGFMLLAITVLVVIALARLWSSVYRARPDPLRLVPLPDSPENPRNSAFDGSGTPPTRW